MDRRLSVSRERHVWIFLGLVVGVVLFAAIVRFLGAFVIGVFVYYATRPLYRRLRYYTWNTIAAGAALAGFLTPVLVLVFYSVLIGSREVQQLAIRYEEPVLQAVAQPFFGVTPSVRSPEQLVTILRAGNLNAVIATVKSVIESVSVLGTVGIKLFLVIVVSFYLLRDGHRLTSWIRSLFPNDLVGEFMKAVDRDFHYIFFGNLLNALLATGIALGIYTGVNLLMGDPYEIPYPMLISVLTGLASLIPIVGMKLVYVPLVGYYYSIAFFGQDSTGFWFATILLVVNAVVIDGIPDLLLRPYISGRDLHVGLLILAYVIGPFLFGWYGLFLGPMLLVLSVHFTQLVLPTLVRKDRSLDDYR